MTTSNHTNLHLSVVQKAEKDLQSQLNKESPTFEDVEYRLTQFVLSRPCHYRIRLIILDCVLPVKQ